MKEWSDYQDQFGGRGKTLKGGTLTQRKRRVREKATEKTERRSDLVAGTPLRKRGRKSGGTSSGPTDLAERSALTGSSSGKGGGNLSKSIRNVVIATVVVLGLVFGAAAYYDVDSDDSLVGAVLNDTNTSFNQPSPSALEDSGDSSALEPTGTPEPTSLTTTERDLSAKLVERLVHEVINQRRSERGLSVISHDQQIRTIARQHSNVMAEYRDIFHIQPDGDDLQDRFDQGDYSCRVSIDENTYSTGAENVAQTWYETNMISDRGELYYDTPRELAVGLVNQWMNSTGHRKNIFKSYWNNEGIGIAIIEQDGKTAVYATQVFC